VIPYGFSENCPKYVPIKLVFVRFECEVQYHTTVWHFRPLVNILLLKYSMYDRHQAEPETLVK